MSKTGVRLSGPSDVNAEGGAVALRIEDYGLLGDLHTAALVGRDGSVDWLCLPRFDSPACFAALLGDDEAGSWQLAPAAGGMCSRRRYRGDSLILETEWDTPDGTVRVIDAMPPRGEAADVVRVVEGVSGRVPMRTAVRLRFDYGSVVPWVRHHDGQVSAIAGPDAAWLSSPAPLHGRDMDTAAEFTVSPGERVPFVLTYRPSHEPTPRPVDAEEALVDTAAFWSDWMGRFRYDGQWADAVRRSLVVLKALTYAPTGGILAAATTSLPEQWRGPRNWDYRFCWLRDATFALQALLGTGFVAEAKAWREWLLRAVAGDPAELQVMYGVEPASSSPASSPRSPDAPCAASSTTSTPPTCGSSSSTPVTPSWPPSPPRCAPTPDDACGNWASTCGCTAPPPPSTTGASPSPSPAPTTAATTPPRPRTPRSGSGPTR